MHNDYKVNYKVDVKKNNKKKLILRFIYIALCIFFLMIVAFFFLEYLKIVKSANDEEAISKEISDSEDKKDISKTADNSDKADSTDAADNTDNTKDTDNAASNLADYDVTIDDEYIIDFSREIAADLKAAGIQELKFPELETYTYGERVPETEVVQDDYFDDAVFIGNSQMEGVAIYSSMKNATVLAGKGIMVDTIFTKEVIKTKDSNRITIISALELKQYGKIYIMLGANELGWVSDIEFIKQYGKVIDKIKELQPEAKIYVNTIIPVSKEKSEKDKIYNNENIERFNKLIINMTKEKQVYYVDSKEALGDEEGNLPANSTTDGVHFNSIYYEKWFNYLKTHTVKS